MTTHFTAKERAFVDALKADTGRDLDAWMAAIRVSGFTERNDVIDWLRQQGFTFANASWLERIHHNGGKLIYPGDGAAPVATPARVVPKPAPPAQSDVESLLAAGKAYRPLAQMILNELLAGSGEARARPLAGHIAVGTARPYAALLPTPKDARLLLALGPGPVEGWETARLAGPALDALRGLTHIKVLSDARQIDAALKHLIRLSVRNCAP